MAYKFDWDSGNDMKSLTKHDISNSEAASVFRDYKKVVFKDVKHSATERRYTYIGKVELLSGFYSFPSPIEVVRYV
jgi:uncharacterized protein